MTGRRGTGPHTVERPRIAMATLLRAATLLTVALGLGGLAPGAAGRASAWAAIIVVIALPLVRVGWLAASWARQGDVRYAAVAAALLVVVLTGAAIAMATN